MRNAIVSFTCLFTSQRSPFPFTLLAWRWAVETRKPGVLLGNSIQQVFWAVWWWRIHTKETVVGRCFASLNYADWWGQVVTNLPFHRPPLSDGSFFKLLLDVLMIAGNRYLGCCGTVDQTWLGIDLILYTTLFLWIHVTIWLQSELAFEERALLGAWESIKNTNFVAGWICQQPQDIRRAPTSK